MAHNRQDRSNQGTRSLRLRFRSKPLVVSVAVIAATAIAAGLYWREKPHAARPTQGGASNVAQPQRHSPEALELLTHLRNRFGSVPQQPNNATPDDQGASVAGTEQVDRTSPLLPGVADDFEMDPDGFLARFPNAGGKPEARVVIPQRAGGAFEVQEIRTGMRLSASIEVVGDNAAEMADGYAIYRDALGPNTAVLRRVMPNGSEDFVSFTEAPREPLVTYRVEFDRSAAGLRTVGNSVEVLDEHGTPRLRVAPPYIVSADGQWVEARLSLNDCAADVDPSAPWNRAPTAPTAARTASCQLRVTWDGDAVKYPALLDPSWTTTGSMATARQGHSATLLADGKVLVAGGTNGSTVLASAELYDRTTGTWAATGSMTGARRWHSAVLLNTSSNPMTSGKVLIAGGRNSTSTLSTAQLYSPTAGTWTAAGNLNAPRQQHTATLLASGKVLVTGGVSGTTVLATAANYNPASGSGSWSATTGPMPSALRFHSASLLTTTNPQLNGKVLVCGGNNGTTTKNAVYLYDPAQLAFSTLANIPSAREGHTATPLPNSKLLLAGGKNGSTTLNTAVLFDPGFGPGSWSTTGNMTVARQAHSATLLSTGQVLVAGGLNGSTTLSSAELYNGTSAWSATVALPAAVQAHSATLLSSGVVLVAGGINGSTTQNAARLYDVAGTGTCTSNSDCASNFCVSGVCCNTACADQCSACDLPGLVGTCSAKSNGTGCNDGNPCTQTDTCQSAACTGSNPITCTASDACHVIGTCDQATGACSNPVAPNGTSCSDNNACTAGDTCQAGTCTPGTSVVTNDDNPCTADACDPVAGVTHTPVAAGTLCSDANSCNGNETCNASGSCLAGTPPALDDSNPCTSDACDPVAGVTHTPVAAGTACGDNDACNGAEVCSAGGTCLPGTPVLCVALDACHIAGSCDSSSGLCSNPAAPNGTGCSDNNRCTAGDSCQSGTCIAGAPVAIDDGNPCTSDSCDAAAGVVHTPVAAGVSCADSNACNGIETCNGSGACVAGTPPSIDDNNPCTSDSCDAVAGVTHTPVAVGTACSDGNACNGSESCDAAGACAAGTPVAVDDGNPCTTDSCNPTTGAIAHDPAPVGTACTNNDICFGGQTCDAQGQCQGGTPANVDDGDPATIDTCEPGQGIKHRRAAAIDKTVITTTLAANEWLFTGTDPIQKGVAPGTIELRRACVLHGYVKDRQGAPIPNVGITVLNHPEFGNTVTHADGRYDMVVNGGGQLTVKYGKEGLLEAQRAIQAPWDDHGWASDVVMIAADPAVTTVDLTSAEPMQVAQGTIKNDADGERQATVMFPVDNVATATLADGSSQTLATLNVRATEFTVGDSGQAAMPAELPQGTAYTYALEINADEAVSMGASSVKFTKPLPLYVANFLGFCPGTTVPVGSYNRELGQWVPENSGIVISILGVSGGLADIGLDTTGTPATAAQLEAIGMNNAEREKLAELFVPGQSLWRALVQHFTSPIDLNWPKPPPPPPPPPPPAPPPPPPPPCTTTCCGSGGGSTGGGPQITGSSILKCSERVYSETIPIGGTPFSLVYESDRVPGYKKPMALSIPIVGASFDSRVLKIYAGVRIDGRDLQFDFLPNPSLSQDFNLLSRDGDRSVYEFRPAANLAYPLNWDGKDLYGNVPVGPRSVTVAVGYFYDSPYWTVDRFGNPGEVIANCGAGPVTGRPPTMQTWRSDQVIDNVGTWDARSVGLGGWTLDAHHSYDARMRLVQFGSGGHSPGAQSTVGLQRIAGQCHITNDTGDNGPALDATLSVYTRSIKIGPDGSVYIAQGSSLASTSRIRKIDAAGVIRTIAGGNELVTPGGYIINSVGDGGLAINASFQTVYDVALGPDGSIYLIDHDHYRVRRINSQGIITTIAGTGVGGYSGDEGPATEAQIGDVRSIDIGPDGSIYIAGDGRIRRITPDGIIHRYAGVPPWPPAPDQDEAPATAVQMSPQSIHVASDGSLYIADYGMSNNGRVRRVTPDGIIHHVKGIGPGGLQNELGSYVYPLTVATGKEGQVYASTSTGNVYLLKDDVAIAVAGGPNAVQVNCEHENRPPTATYPGTSFVRAGPAGELYVSVAGKLMRIDSTYPGLSKGGNLVQYQLPDAANNQLYEFDVLGRHLGTRNLTTGASIYTFGYDANGLLTSITHDNGKQTIIQRDANGVAQAIVGAYGQTTQLTDYDANGYVRTVTDPLGNTSEVAYSTAAESLGLVTTFTNTRGNSATVTYNPDGTVAKDQDALGGFKSLTLLDLTPTSSDIQLQTALGVSTFYHFEQHADGSKRDVVTWPDATTTISERLASEVSNITQPDGTTIRISRDPDPVWGMHLPVITTTTTLPSGLQKVQSSSRSATTDPADPAVLTAETVAQTINSRSTTTTFDVTQRKYTTTTPAGRVTGRYVDTNLRTTRIERPNIADLIFAYDADNRLASITQGTRVTSRTYYSGGDVNGYLQTLTNPLTQTTTFVPDAFGRTLLQTLDTATTAFTWDEANNLTSVTPPGKPTHLQTYTPVNLLEDYIPPAAGLTSYATNYQYNLDRQLLTETRPDTVVTNRSYDPAGRLDLMTMPTGALDYTYYEAGCTSTGCAAGKLASIAGPGAETLSFTYDGQLQTSTTWSGLVNGSVSWTYDNDFRKVSETVQAGTTTATAAFGYDADSLLTCASPTTCPSGAGALTITRDPQNALLVGTSLGTVTDAYTYNVYGELATYSAQFGTTPLYSVTYDSTTAPRDGLGRVAQKTETLQGTTHVFGYTYDVQGRLTDVTRDGTAIEHYGYDANGNRTTATVNGTTLNPTYDEQDRLLTYGGTTFTYTANGEMRTKTDSTGTTTYTYDAVGSLIAVSLPDGRLIEYVTDGKGRRIGKLVNGVLVKQWLYRDQLKPVAELDGAGNIVAEFIYGTKPNLPDLVIRGGTTYRVLSDQLGSPVMAVNVANSSDVPFAATYSAWGERTLLVGSNEWVPFGFAGGIYDADTGLTGFGARDYDARLGRWVSKDPIRFEGDLANIYVYVGDDPIDISDPEGKAMVCSLVCNGVKTAAVAACTYATEGVGFWGCQMTLGGSLGLMCAVLCSYPPPPPAPPPPGPMCYSNNDWNTAE